MTATSHSNRPVKTDILIIGGGMAGLTMACALADGGFDVICVDRENPAGFRDAGFDGRASAIAEASRRLFQGIGLWQGMEAAASPILGIRVSDRNSPLFLHYDHAEIGNGPFGFMVENRVFRSALLERVPNLKHLTHMAPDTVKTLDRSAYGVSAKLGSGLVINGSLAIAADGRNSQTRSGANIHVSGWSYKQSGIVCTVDHERPHGGVAHERFLAAGPFAILPLKGNRSSLVWTEPPDTAAAIMNMDESGFLGQLESRFGDFLGGLSVVGGRWCYPLSLQFAETSVAERLALVGDAAHAMHPIAGQGLNMGLRDVAALAEVLVDARRLGLDIGSGVVLERYEQWRRFDNTLMLAMTDGLNRFFAVDVQPLTAIRDMGMAVVNRALPLKRLFSSHAMGLVGELPRLMRGLPL